MTSLDTHPSRYRLAQREFGDALWTLVPWATDQDLALEGYQLATQGFDLASLEQGDRERLIGLLRAHPNYPEVVAASMARAKAIFDKARGLPYDEDPPDVQEIRATIDAELKDLLSITNRCGPVPPIDIDVGPDADPADADAAVERVCDRLRAAGLSFRIWKTNERGGTHVEIGVDPEVRHPDLLRLVGSMLGDIIGNSVAWYSHHRRKDGRSPIIWDDSLYNHYPNSRGRMWRLPGSAKPKGFARELRTEGDPQSAPAMVDRLAPYVEAFKEKAQDHGCEICARGPRPVVSVRRIRHQTPVTDHDLSWLCEQSQYLNKISEPGSSTDSARDYHLARQLLEAGATPERTTRLLYNALSRTSSRNQGRYVERTVESAARHVKMDALGIEEPPRPESVRRLQDPNWTAPAGLSTCHTRIGLVQRRRNDGTLYRCIGVPCGSIHCGYCGPQKMNDWIDRPRAHLQRGGLLYRLPVQSPRTDTSARALRRFNPDLAYLWIDAGDGQSVIYADRPFSMYGDRATLAVEGLSDVWNDLIAARDYRKKWQGAVSAGSAWRVNPNTIEQGDEEKKWETLGTIASHWSPFALSAWAQRNGIKLSHTAARDRRGNAAPGMTWRIADEYLAKWVIDDLIDSHASHYAQAG